MKKLFFLLLILLVGCKTDFNLNKSPIESFTVSSEGLVVEKIKNMPPDKIFESEEFKFGLEVINKGSEEIKGAHIYLGGLNPNYFEFDSKELDKKINLESRSKFNPEGGKTLIEVTAKNTGIPVGTVKEYIAPYEVGIEYEYNTKSNAEVCIDSGVESVLKVCTGELTSLSSQGSPVSLSKVKQFTTNLRNGKVANFELTFKKFGKGKVNGDVVKLINVKLSDKNLKCKSESKKLKEDQLTFFCTLDLQSNVGNYKTVLSSEIIYNYRSIHEGKIIVQKYAQE